MQSDTPIASDSKKMQWAGYVLSALSVLAMFFSGAMKLTQSDAVTEGFAQLGYPAGLAVGIGVVELACAILYAIPRTSVLGAILLTGYLGGATATQVRVGEQFFGPVILGVLVWGGLYLRDYRLRALLPLRS